MQGIKQREGGPFGNIKKIRKNLKIENFEKSHSAEKSEKRTLWDSLTFVLLQGIKQREGGPFGNIKKIRKKIKIENFEQPHSAESSKKGPFWDF